MIKKLTLSLVATAVAAAALLAQPPARRGDTPPDPAAFVERRVDFLAKLLSLTEDQQARAKTIFAAAGEAVQAVNANFAAPREALAEAIKTNSVAAIDQAAGEIGRLHGQVTAIQAKADAAFYAILTPDQRTKYDAMPRGGPGPGFGPGGFGPGGRGMMGRGRSVQ
jgi:Spy/CpxP family protein refolding chaperone